MNQRLAWSILAIVAAAVVAWVAFPGSDPPIAPGDAGSATARGTEPNAAAESAPPERDALAPADAAAGGSPAAPVALAARRGRLQLQVVDVAGRALAGCAAEIGAARGTTDADGRVVLEPGEGRQWLSVEPPTKNLGAAWGAITVVAEETLELTVVLRPVGDRDFFCRFVGADDGRPVPAVVCVDRASGRKGTADQDGYYHARLDVEQTQIDASAPGFAPRIVGPQPGHETQDAAMQVPLRRAAELRLLVEDPRQQRVDPQSVRLVLRYLWDLRWPPTADLPLMYEVEWPGQRVEAGAFTFTDLPLETELLPVVSLAVGEYSAPKLSPVVLQPGPNDLRITLVAHGGFRGRVLDADGRKLAGAAVECTRILRGVEAQVRSGAKVEPLRLTSDGDGAFAAAGVDPGDWRAEVGGLGSGQRASQQFVVSAGAIATVELRVQPALGLSGRVVDPAGRPAANLEVHARGATGKADSKTSAEGLFRFEGLAPGDYKLTVEPHQKQFGLAQPVLAKAGATDVELRLAAVYGTLMGTVVDGTSGVPANAWVFAQQRDGDDSTGNANDLDGRFEFGGLRAGTWDLTANDPRGRAAWLPGIVVVPGQTTRGLLLQLHPGATLRVSNPEADEFFVQRGSDVAARDALPEGRPTTAIVLPGSYTVVFFGGGRELGRRDVVVRAGQILDVRGP